MTGFDDAGQADLGHRGAAVCLAVGEAVRGGRQAQLLRREPPDAFAVHGNLRRPRGGDDGEALALQREQSLRRDGLNLGDNEVGPLVLGDFAQGVAVEHIDDVGPVRDLHGGRIGIAVHGDDFDPQSLQLDDDFFAKLPTPAHHDFGRTRGEGSSEGGHRAVSYWRGATDARFVKTLAIIPKEK